MNTKKNKEDRLQLYKAVLEGSRIFHERILHGDDSLSKHADKKRIKEVLKYIYAELEEAFSDKDK